MTAAKRVGRTHSGWATKRKNIMSNDLNTNTASVTLPESKPSNVPAPAAAPAAPAGQPTAGNKKERYNKKSGGGFGGLPRTKV
jgi:hypothetical protein